MSPPEQLVRDPVVPKVELLGEAQRQQAGKDERGGNQQGRQG